MATEYYVALDSSGKFVWGIKYDPEERYQEFSRISAHVVDWKKGEVPAEHWQHAEDFVQRIRTGGYGNGRAVRRCVLEKHLRDRQKL